jgi:hypothetical protein
MSILRKPYGSPTLLAVLSLCVLFGLISGCSKVGKKEKAEFKPGSAWIEDMRNRIEDNIQDPDKKNSMLALVDQTEKDLLEVDQAVRKLYTDFSSLSENYNSTPEEFRKVISEFEASRRAVRGRVIENRFKMRDLSTPAEWKKLTDISKSKGLYQQTIRQPYQ